MLQNTIDQLKEITATAKNGTTEQKATAIKRAVDILSFEFEPEAKSLVEDINSRIETTRGHYGDYLSFLSTLKGFYRIAFYVALKRAGAGQGVEDAYQIILGQ